jgi:hypothetical protein
MEPPPVILPAEITIKHYNCPDFVSRVFLCPLA